MNKKPYIKPTAVLFQFSITDSIAGEVIISTSNATVIGGGGELNAKEGTFVDDELDESDEEFLYKPIHSLWDEEE